jgi:uncharacterized protein (TIGR04551 family)
MMTRWLPALIAAAMLSAPALATAQTEGEDTPADDAASADAPAAEGAAEGDDAKPSGDAEKADDDEEDPDAEPEGTPPEGEPEEDSAFKPVEPEPEAEPEPEPEKKPEKKPEPERPLTGDGPGISPIADLKSDDTFVPLQDIEEETLDPIFPATAYPYVEWHGGFRFRSIVANGFDLGTDGTSATLPPIEAWAPLGNAAQGDAAMLWTNNMRLRLEPTFHVGEELSVHLEADFLDNMVLGATPLNGLPNDNPLRPDPSRNRLGADQISPRAGSEWFQNPVEVNEAYGEVSSFFGTLRVGRMDNHWGLGMFYNGGDCDDCDFGDHIDRIYLRTRVQGFYGALAVEFPAEGLVGAQPNMPDGAPNDLSQLDDAAQFTLQLWRSPTSQRERELEQKVLVEDRKPVVNGGLLASWRTQQGATLSDANPPTPRAPLGPTNPGGVASNPALIYQGVQMFVVDGWGEFLYQPDAKTKIEVQLEAMTAFGSVDNTTYEAVDRDPDAGDGADDVNCFDETVRNANEGVCRANARDFFQLGVALRSKFELGGPVAFGLNGGYASGGSAANWGWRATDGADLDFFRFDPDYHVDLILFRNVIGTVTNAVYASPYLQASFLESGDRKVRLDVNGIISHAVNLDGTPAGSQSLDTNGSATARSGLLGVELDAAARYILAGTFNASLEGGILFPLDGLAAVSGRERLTVFGNNANTFSDDVTPSTAWTVQFKLNWKF